MSSSAPPFTSEAGWLEETERVVLEHYEASDGEERVPPMALVRCSRGGKTRALLEVARMLKSRNIPVVMISLNDYSSLKEWEKVDGVGAVCRRIAFAASLDRDFGRSLEQYEHFSRQNWNVTAQQVEDWLGSHPCILLQWRQYTLNISRTKRGEQLPNAVFSDQSTNQAILKRLVALCHWKMPLLSHLQVSFVDQRWHHSVIQSLTRIQTRPIQVACCFLQ